MPAEWVLLAAGAAMEGAAGGPFSDLYYGAKEKVVRLISDGSLSKPLEQAYTDALKAFAGFLDSFPLTYATEERLREIHKDPVFRQVVGQLLYVPFRSIDTAPLWDVFRTLGIEEATEADFDAAWRVLGRSFELSMARSPELKSLVDHHYAIREEVRDEEKVEKLAELVRLVERLLEVQEEARKTPDHAPALRAYSAALYQQYRFADTRGLFMREKESVGEGIELLDVFVETALVPVRDERKEEELKPGEGEKGRPPWRENVEIQDFLGQALRLSELLARERFVVLLGPPGSGKSTLLRCLALTLCRPEGREPICEQFLDAGVIPVLLPLKEFASELKTRSSLELDRFLFERFDARLPGLREFLVSGRVLVLFDGLDEVFDELHRGWVSEQVWRFTTQFPHAKVVLSSRPRGYEAAPLPGPVPRWNLLPFNKEQIGGFFRGWFEALAREGAEAGADEPPERRAKALTDEVLSRKRLKEMAQNPLLCTLIVLVHRSRSGRLPERRVVFYEAAVRTLAEAWEKMKRQPRQEAQERLEFPEPEILLRALAEVSWRVLHDFASREIPGPHLRSWLREYLEREPEWRGRRGERAVRDFLNLVGERTGLLVDLGGDRFQFVHLSLHEWLASYYLLDRLTESRRKEVVRYYLHAPEWEEVLRLLVGGAPQAQADILAADLLANPTSNWEQALCRDLRFIARCLGDQAPVGLALRNRIVDRIVVALNDKDNLYRIELSDDIIGLGHVTEVGEAIEKWLGDKDPLMRNAAVRFFTQDSVPSTRAVGRIEVMMRDDVDRVVRRSAVEFFTKKGDRSYDGFFRTALRSSNWRLRQSAIDFFTFRMDKREEVKQEILKNLTNEADLVRYSSVEYFARIAERDPVVYRAMYERVEADSNSSIRQVAMKYFLQVGIGDKEVVNYFVGRLTSLNRAECRTAIEFLAKCGVESPDINEMIYGRLWDDDKYLRLSAAKYLAQTAPDDEQTRRVLLVWLKMGDKYFRLAAIAFFARTGGDSKVKKIILERINDPDASVRRAAVEFFSQVGDTDERVVSFVWLRISDPDRYVRSAAADFLSRVLDSESLGKRAITCLAEAGEESHVGAFQVLVRTGFGLEQLVPLLEIYEKSLKDMTVDDERFFSERLGKFFVVDPQLFGHIVGSYDYRNIDLRIAIQAAAVYEDTIRRKEGSGNSFATTAFLR